MSLTEQQIQNWARPLSATENDKCIKTVASIRKILEDHFGSKVKVFLQGSYANSTNVRQDSDVDIIVCYQDAYYSDLRALNEQEKIHHEQGRVSHDYTFSKFKDDVEILLNRNFPNLVNRKEKCLKIEGNTYRVNADVVPCFTHKRFQSPYKVSVEGVHLFTDSGTEVMNFPDHHKNNGQSKNQRTGTKYKSVVRILKNCKNHLVDNKHIDEKLMNSFFLESLIWNVPDSYFKEGTDKYIVNNIIGKIYEDMSDESIANKYAEINDLMWLFHGVGKKSSNDVKTFLEYAHKIIN